MIRKRGSLLSILCLILFVAVIGFIAFTVGFDGKVELSAQADPSLSKSVLERPLPFEPGEKLTYSVVFKKLKIGKAVLTFHGTAELDGEEVYFITFDTDTSGFRDLEKIYAQKGTFLPLRVERQFRRLGSFTQRIVEEYDQEAFKVEISKKGAIHTRKDTIEKTSPIHNAILLSYIYRADFDRYTKEKHSVNLPTKEFEIFYAGKDEVKVPLEDSQAHIFASDPEQFKLCLKDDEKMMPLLIEDPNAFGYALKLKSVEEEAVEEKKE